MEELIRETSVGIGEVISHIGCGGHFGFDNLRVYQETPFKGAFVVLVTIPFGLSGRPEVRVTGPSGDTAYYTVNGEHIIGNEPPPGFNGPLLVE